MIKAKTKHLEIEKKDNFYIVWWNLPTYHSGWNKFYDRDRAFRFAYELLRAFRKYGKV